MEIFEQKFRIELTEIAMNFGIKPTAILRYMQETFARYCAKHDVAGYDVYDMGLKWVFGKIYVEFSDILPLWSEEITVKAYIGNAQALRMFVNFEISTQRGIFARAQSSAYTIDCNTSKPVPIKNMLDKFNVKKEDLKSEIIKTNFDINGDIISKYEHKVGISDIDFNNHTNNISYVSFGLSGLPKNYITERFPKMLEIKYLKETFLGDVLDCEIKQSGDNFEHTITTGDNKEAACIVKSVWSQNIHSFNNFVEMIKKEKKNFFS